MPLPDLSNLPPWALVIFAVCLAVVAGAVLFGRRQGQTAPTHQRADSAELSMMTIDTRDARQTAAAIEGMNLTLIEQNKILREQKAEMAELRVELRRQGEAARR